MSEGEGEGVCVYYVQSLTITMLLALGVRLLFPYVRVRVCEGECVRVTM